MLSLWRVLFACRPALLYLYHRHLHSNHHFWPFPSFVYEWYPEVAHGNISSEKCDALFHSFRYLPLSTYLRSPGRASPASIDIVILCPYNKHTNAISWPRDLKKAYSCTLTARRVTTALWNIEKEAGWWMGKEEGFSASAILKARLGWAGVC